MTSYSSNSGYNSSSISSSSSGNIIRDLEMSKENGNHNNGFMKMENSKRIDSGGAVIAGKPQNQSKSSSSNTDNTFNNNNYKKNNKPAMLNIENETNGSMKKATMNADYESTRINDDDGNKHDEHANDDTNTTKNGETNDDDVCQNDLKALLPLFNWINSGGKIENIMKLLNKDERKTSSPQKSQKNQNQNQSNSGSNDSNNNANANNKDKESKVSSNDTKRVVEIYHQDKLLVKSLPIKAAAVEVEESKSKEDKKMVIKSDSLKSSSPDDKSGKSNINISKETKSNSPVHQTPPPSYCCRTATGMASPPSTPSSIGSDHQIKPTKSSSSFIAATTDLAADDYNGGGSRHSILSSLTNKRGSFYPPFSSLLIFYSKLINQTELLKEFEAFGLIENIRSIDTQDSDSGKLLIKYSKTSEAARAYDQLNGKCFNQNSEPIKIHVMNCRYEDDEFSLLPNKNHQLMLQLFILIGRTITKNDLYEKFSKFGTVDKVYILTDPHTKASRGLAYITFSNISSAAKAYEECSTSFMAKFAYVNKPNKTKQRSGSYRDDDNDSLASSSEYNRSREYLNKRSRSRSRTRTRTRTRSRTRSRSPLSRSRQESTRRFSRSPSLKNRKRSISPPQNTFGGRNWTRYSRDAPNKSNKLFISTRIDKLCVSAIVDLVPGLREFVQIDSFLAKYCPGLPGCYKYHNNFMVTYEDQKMADFALEKLSNVEFPFGQRMRVFYFDESRQRDRYRSPTPSARVRSRSRSPPPKPRELNGDSGEKSITNSKQQQQQQKSDKGSSTASFTADANNGGKAPQAQNNKEKDTATIEKKTNEKLTISKDETVKIAPAETPVIKKLQTQRSLPVETTQQQQQPTAVVPISPEEKQVKLDPRLKSKTQSYEQTKDLILKHLKLPLNSTQNLQQQLSSSSSSSISIQSPEISNNDHQQLHQQNSSSLNNNNESGLSNYTITAIYCRNPTTVEMLKVILSAFNYVEIFLKDDGQTAFALFNSIPDAQLAVNSINNRTIAQNFFRCQIDCNPSADSQTFIMNKLIEQKSKPKVPALSEKLMIKKGEESSSNAIQDIVNKDPSAASSSKNTNINSNNGATNNENLAILIKQLQSFPNPTELIDTLIKQTRTISTSTNNNSNTNANSNNNNHHHNEDHHLKSITASNSNSSSIHHSHQYYKRSSSEIENNNKNNNNNEKNGVMIKRFKQ